MQSEESVSLAEPLCLVHNWQATQGAKHYVNVLLRYNKRKVFGLLENPYASELKHNNVLLLHKKLYLAGKAGVGKTSIIDKLAGRDIKQSHEETAGIQTHTIYWPFKIESPDVVGVAQLELWDTGERALQKFDHIRPACLNATHGTLLVFSYQDRKSWEELPRLMSSLNLDGCDTLKAVVGTHADSLQREVTSREVEEFEQRHGVLVLPVDNTAGARLAASPSLPDGRENIKAISSFLNALVEVILAQEQKQQNSSFMYSLQDASRPSPEHFMS